LAHSHIVIRHLVQGLEARGRDAIDIRIPEVIETFVHSVAELFEPFSGAARVGYECNFADGSFEISMFVGAREIVGGQYDGRQESQNFRFNLQGLFDRFDSIQSFLWNAIPQSPLNDGGLSFVVVEGLVQGHIVRLQLHPTAPEEMGPAIREYLDGSVELAD
jgi:hypothetical protein